MDESLRKSIAVEHEKAEIIISWIQLAFVVTLLGIYLIAPKANDNPGGFEPVPVVMGVYLPLICFRTWWAHKRMLNEPTLMIYCLFDTVMVSVLIYLFHIQYGASITVSLKAPTYLYLLMFIALRVLRAEVKYIVTMGVMSIISMSVMIALALNDPNVTVTKSFLKFASSNSLLVGAEVDKILAIAMIVVILTVAVYRNQRLMVRNVHEAQARKDLSRFFSPDVAENIVSSSNSLKPGDGIVRSAAILSMDIRGFTTMSQTASPAEIMSLLSEYQKKMVCVILENGGSIDKFMGDGILAHFGAAKATTTYAADCLRATDALVREARLWNEERKAYGKPELKFGIAATVGDVMFGAVGDESRLEFTTIGDAVNLCAKLEKHTKEVDAFAVTTLKALDIGTKQGYLKRNGQITHLEKCEIEGIRHTIDLVVLHFQDPDQIQNVA